MGVRSSSCLTVYLIFPFVKMYICVRMLFPSDTTVQVFWWLPGYFCLDECPYKLVELSVYITTLIIILVIDEDSRGCTDSRYVVNLGLCDCADGLVFGHTHTHTAYQHWTAPTRTVSPWKAAGCMMNTELPLCVRWMEDRPEDGPHTQTHSHTEALMECSSSLFNSFNSCWPGFPDKSSWAAVFTTSLWWKWTSLTSLPHPPL